MIIVDIKLLIVFIQIMLAFLLIAIITVLLRVNSAFKLEKRISRYSVRYSDSNSNVSIFDKVWSWYKLFVKRQRKKMRKLFPTLINRYDKYVSSEEVKAADYITHKFVVAIIFVILTIVGMAIQGKFVTLLQLLISFVIGFFILDIGLIIQNRINRKKIENDMLKAIIVMNNVFKSGKSTIQAVEIASKKLTGPIGYEFKKIYQEMKYGLSVDAVFDRFSKRVKIESAEYLSSSLTILNKTGGNIIAVFDSIEKTLFDKKKLEEELKNLTTVSKLVIKILTFVPVLFVFVIYMLDRDYFKPFFESTLGYILMLIIFLMFLIYVYLLNRIVKVE